MPIAFDCESCQRPYKVDDKFAGKRVKCKECGSAMEVPVEKVRQTKVKTEVSKETKKQAELEKKVATKKAVAKQPVAQKVVAKEPIAKKAVAEKASAPKAEKVKASKTKAAVATKPSKETVPTRATKPAVAKKQKVAVAAHAGEVFQLDEIQQTDDLFGAAPVRGKANPLGNHVVSDPGFAAIDMAAIEAKMNEPETPQFSANPALAEAQALNQQTEVPEKKPKKSKNLTKPALFSAIASVLLFLILFIPGFFLAPVMLIGAILLFAIGGCIALWATIWGMVSCFQNNKEVFIWYFLIPIYRLFYTAKHWEFMKGPFLLTCASFLFSAFGAILLVLGIVIHGDASGVQ